MNVFNKIIVTLLLLALLALVILLALFPLELLRALEAAFRSAGTGLRSFSFGNPLLFGLARVGVAVLGIVILLPLLWQQIKPRRPKAVRVVTESGSQAAVTTDAVARRLAWHLDQLADVVSVTPTVTGGRGGVNVNLKVQTRPEVDVPMKTDEIVAVAREVVTERMGLQLGKIKVDIDHAPYTEGVA